MRCQFSIWLNTDSVCHSLHSSKCLDKKKLKKLSSARSATLKHFKVRSKRACCCKNYLPKKVIKVILITGLNWMRFYEKTLSYLAKCYSLKHNSRVQNGKLTQQLPQAPWSRISFVDGQSDHCSLESNVDGISCSMIS